MKYTLKHYVSLVSTNPIYSKNFNIKHNTGVRNKAANTFEKCDNFVTHTHIYIYIYSDPSLFHGLAIADSLLRGIKKGN